MAATIALTGTLGAGKTRLVQAVAVAAGVNASDVTSPTFVLCQLYRGRQSIQHLDAYRVRDIDEFVELGVEEYFDGPGWTFVEWSDRVAACLPDDHLEIQIEVTGREARRFTCIAHGPVAEAALLRIIAAL